MRVLVTGATEFVGLNVVRALCAEGHEVHGYALPASNVSYLATTDARIHTGELDRPHLIKLMRGVEAVVNCAGAASVSGSPSNQHILRQLDIEGTRAVVEAAVEAGVRRLIHTSTTATIGANDDPLRQWAEDTPLTVPRLDASFVRTKLESEAIVRAAVVHGLDTIILNPAEIVGGWDHALSGWGGVVVAVAAGKKLPVPAGTGSFGAASEIGRAHAAALIQGTIGARYVLAGSDASYADVFAEIGRVAGAAPPSTRSHDAAGDPFGALSADDAPDSYREGMLAGHYRFDSSRAVRELGYRVVPVPAMVREAYDWYRANGFVSPRGRDP